MNSYTKENPSSKYLELGEQYKQLHEEGEKSLNLKPEETFQGISLAPQLAKIKKGIALTGSQTLLDYGCGKALAWQPGNFLDINGSKITTQEFLNVNEVYLYDPGYQPYATEPANKYDAVICTDVLEHIPEADIRWFVNELFAYANKYVFANIAIYPANKILPNGENAHCTIKPIDWWKSVFDDVCAAYPEVEWEIWLDYFEGNVLQERGLSRIQEKNSTTIKNLKSSVLKTIQKTTDLNLLNTMARDSIAKGNLADAKAYLQKAIQLDPALVDSYITLSSIYMREKDFLHAQSTLRSYPKYLNNEIICDQLYKNYTKMAIGYMEKNDCAPALIYFSASLEFASAQNALFAYKKMAECALTLQNYTELKKYVFDAYNAEPEDPEILYMAGQYFFSVLNFEEAKLYFQKASAAAPEDPLYITALAKLELEVGDRSLAYQHIQHAFGLDQFNLETLRTYAKIAHASKYYDEALKIYQQIHSLTPNDASNISAMGALLLFMNRYDKAEALLAEALRLSPLNPTGLLNMGALYLMQGKYNDSIKMLEKGVTAYPNIWQFHYYLSTGYLGQFDFKKGWQEFKYRIENLDELGNLKNDTAIFPEDLRNKRIYVYAEQGLGDELFFLRFFEILKQKGAWIAYRPREKLYNVLARCPFIDTLVRDGWSEPIDYVCSVTELPRLLNINSADLIPDPLPLGINEDIQRSLFEKLTIHKPPLIGITWRAGTSDDINSYSKEVPLKELLPYLKQLDATIVVLQRNPLKEEIQWLQETFGENLVEASALNDDLEKMLALLSLLDKYIAVSNTNIHLSASIQKKCHILIPFPAEWRWGNNDSDSSPWFKGFKLYRQKSHQADWNREFERLIEDIKQEFDEKKSLHQKHLNTINESIRLIDQLIELERYPEAEALCQKILSIDEHNIDALLQYAKVLNLTNQHEILLRIIDKIGNISK